MTSRTMTTSCRTKKRKLNLLIQDCFTIIYFSSTIIWDGLQKHRVLLHSRLPSHRLSLDSRSLTWLSVRDNIASTGLVYVYYLEGRDVWEMKRWTKQYMVSHDFWMRASVQILLPADFNIAMVSFQYKVWNVSCRCGVFGYQLDWAPCVEKDSEIFCLYSFIIYSIIRLNGLVVRWKQFAYTSEFYFCTRQSVLPHMASNRLFMAFITLLKTMWSGMVMILKKEIC